MSLLASITAVAPDFLSYQRPRTSCVSGSLGESLSYTTHALTRKAGTQPGVPGSLPGNSKRDFWSALVLGPVRGFRLRQGMRSCREESHHFRMQKENDSRSSEAHWNGYNFIQESRVIYFLTFNLLVVASSNSVFHTDPGSWEWLLLEAIKLKY